MDVGQVDGAGDGGDGFFRVGAVGRAEVEGGGVGAAVGVGIGAWHGGVGGRVRVDEGVCFGCDSLLTWRTRRGCGA